MNDWHSVIAVIGMFFAICTGAFVSIVLFGKRVYEPVDHPKQEEDVPGEFASWAEHSKELREFD